ncbi:hypothetical protein DEI20_24160 [Salmonella enterica subsp. enterica serovar Newport]|nr:hypothetical protein [Salmonella enterica subsp. enterica serovar Newport]MJR82395.1 hypothetical protein [Salmonella enterica subsp. enterica serovar Newport]
MVTEQNDNAEDGGFLFPDTRSGDGGEESSAGFTVPEAWSLSDFARRVRACETPWRLELLHTLMRRTVPVGQRAGYIALLNQRDEELSFQSTEII